ncbi:hypothetical protein BU25DRAFT_408551 [Macroventuria anomochaeta]|uniref:Uncharacterized protein n=1 Tax=Macroventuria anomochaeta TaxID=301207 RepID=A0ACB6S9E3_9PLEO|nr:uncharacterized protein BU25DRAFT_408551 [Macroventuria anomochaeta]KAF2629954.1 hypothetical protein BU25DRAFT_408551 [Macroventuria anomochaeta]
MSSRGGGRGRGGKFNKVKRGGGHKFSRDLQPLNADGEVAGMWGEPVEKVEDESSEESSEEDSSEDDEDKPKEEEMTREQRRDAAKARKQAAIAKKNKIEVGDMPTSDEESSDDNMPANPNHTAKARQQASKAPVDPEAAPAAANKGKAKQDTSQLSRREREALEKQQAKERYDKLHAEGKTDQARADLERLKLVKERREAEAARKKAEAEERAELEKEKAELMAREARRREQAMGKANRLAKGGKKK